VAKGRHGRNPEKHHRLWRPDGTKINFLAGEIFVSQETNFLAGEYVPAHIALVAYGMCIRECIEYWKLVYETLEKELAI
jgi:hypothetical protein